jgi:8-oxo-dGTP pyrophosphatase MutT (NUDIX family)
MQHATVLDTEILLPRPKRFVHQALRMPDGYELDWYYVDTPASVMIVPLTADEHVVMVRQYRHNLKRHALELPAGVINPGETSDHAAARELHEETGYALLNGAHLQLLGTFYSLPSETNKYTEVFLARPVISTGPPAWDNEIEKYFDMSVITMPLKDALDAIGTTINGMETTTALLIASR